MTYKLGRKEQAGLLDVVGAGAASLAALAVHLAAQGHLYSDMPTGSMLGPPHSSFLFYKMRDWTTDLSDLMSWEGCVLTL